MREPYDAVLIVCEGGKSEPNYLGRLRDVHRLSNANIKITPADGTDPLSVVNTAEELSAHDDYDRVYCVFDRDDHRTYDAALAKAADLRFYAIASWPCFEIWLLLHFVYSSAPRTRQEAYEEVRKHYSVYGKGCRTVYDDLMHLRDQAIRHGQRLATESVRQGFQNPATKMHELVEYLLKLKA